MTTQSAFVKSYNLAKAYEQDQNFLPAFNIYYELAQKNFVPAMASSAYCLTFGIGTAIDLSLAVKWAKPPLLTTMYQSKHRVCHFILGYSFDVGYFDHEKWVQDAMEAEHYYNLSHQGGFLLATFFLAKLYHVQKSPRAEQMQNAAIYSLNCLIIQNNSVARACLGHCYETDCFVDTKKNTKEYRNYCAYSYFQQAATQNNARAHYGLSVAYDKGIHVKGTDRIVQKDSFFSLYSLECAARQGHREAQLDLSDYYEKKNDLIWARFWLKEAAFCSDKAREKFHALSCPIVATEVFDSEIVFRTAQDPRPLLTTLGGKNCIAMGGYVSAEQMAFLAVFTSIEEVHERAQSFLQKIQNPVQIYFSYRESYPHLLMAIDTFILKKLRVLTDTKIRPSLIIDARTGFVTTYTNRPQTIPMKKNNDDTTSDVPPGQKF
jgi:TPR repeat protein